MDKALKLSFVVIASCLLLGAQQGVQMVIMTGPQASGGVTGLLDGWPMNEGSGTTFFDAATTNPTNASFNTSPAITFGAVGGWPSTPATFAGGNGAGDVSVGAPNYQMSGTTPFSVCAWVKATSFPGGGSAIISNLLAPFDHFGWQLSLSASGQIQAYFAGGAVSGNNLFVQQTTGNSTGANLQTCWTYDGSKTPAGVTIYANGSSVATTTVDNTLTGNIGSVAIGLGVIQNGGGGISPFSGTIGYASVWNCVLTAGVISTNNAAGPSFTGLHC